MVEKALRSEWIGHTWSGTQRRVHFAGALWREVDALKETVPVILCKLGRRWLRDPE